MLLDWFAELHAGAIGVALAVIAVAVGYVGNGRS